MTAQGRGAYAVIDLRALSDAARMAIASDPRQLVTALRDGDDYEILFTAPATAVSA